MILVPSSSPLVKFWHSSLFVTRTVARMYDRTPSPLQPLAFFIFSEKYRCENGWSTTPRFISFPLRAFWSMIFWRKRPERKNEVHEFPVWNVHEAHGRSTAVGRNAPSRTQTIILQVIYLCIRVMVDGRPLHSAHVTFAVSHWLTEWSTDKSWWWSNFFLSVFFLFLFFICDILS